MSFSDVVGGRRALPVPASCRVPLPARETRHTLTRKLEGHRPLSEHDRWALNGLVTRVREVDARVDLIGEGDPQDDVHLILEGFACRYKILGDGRRQIVAYLVPGDLCDLNGFVLDAMDHNVGTVSRCQVVDIPRRCIEDLTTHHPGIARALWWCSLVDEAVLRAWLVNLGGRPANQRIAHLLCELLTRMGTVGRCEGGGIAFPFTQADLADATGMSSVHVNRTLRELRDLGLVTLARKVLTVHDVGRLREYCAFDPAYLHLGSHAAERSRDVSPARLARG